MTTFKRCNNVKISVIVQLRVSIWACCIIKILNKIIIFANICVYVTVSYTDHLDDYNNQFISTYKDLDDYIMNSIFFFILIENSHNHLLILHCNSLLDYLTNLCKKEINTADIMTVSCYHVQHAEWESTYSFSEKSSVESEKKILKNDITVYKENRRLINIINFYFWIWEDCD